MRQFLINEIENKNLTLKEVAFAIEVSLEVINDYLFSHEDNFDLFLKIIRYVQPEKEKELIRMYITDCQDQATVCACLEYTSTHRMLDLMKELLNYASGSSNVVLQEWASVYALQYEWQSNFKNIDSKDHYREIRKTKVTIEETDLFSRILEVYSLYYQHNHLMAYKLSINLLEDIDRIKDNYIKFSFQGRLFEILSYVSLRVLNDVTKAREYADKLINANIGDTFNGFATYIIGISYLFESYELCNENVTKSYEMYLKTNEISAVNVKDKLIFTKLYWDKDITEEITGNLNKAYMYIRQYKTLEALDVLDSLDETEDPMVIFLKGLARLDKDLLIRSMIAYLRAGDTFMSSLPKFELKRLGYYTNFIDDLFSINLPIKETE